MAELNTYYHHPHPKEPSFLAVVALAAVALIVIFVVSFLMLIVDGPKLVPGAQPRNGEPVSQLITPSASAVDA